MKIADNTKEYVLIVPECKEDQQAFAQILKAQQIEEVIVGDKIVAIRIKKIYE